MKVHLRNLGCRLNEAEVEGWARDFQSSGHAIVTDQAEADLIVLNSCAVTAEAVRKSRAQLRRLQRENPAAKLAVSGCYATLSPQEAATELGVDLVVPNQDKARLANLVVEQLDLPSPGPAATEPAETSLFQRNRNRAFVKVQDGCRYRCTFCIVTVARGEERSVPLEQIIDEVGRLHAAGIQEVVLTGVHIGGYGSDLNLDLSRLIRGVLADTDIPRLRLGSVEPWDLPEDFGKLFDNPRFMPHLHLPLQSGADSVLRRMARRCKSGDFQTLVERLRGQVPDLNITSDIIVGFPGEDEREWQQSLDFVRRMHFGHLHIFSYSPRTGTKAAGLPNAVPTALKKARSRELHALAAEMKLRSLNRHLGRTLPVLWEGHGETQADGRQRFWGYAPNFLRVQADIPDSIQPANRILEAEVHGISASGDTLVAELLAPKD